VGTIAAKKVGLLAKALDIVPKNAYNGNNTSGEV